MELFDKVAFRTFIDDKGQEEIMNELNDLLKDAYEEGFDTGYNQCLIDKESEIEW